LRDRLRLLKEKNQVRKDIASILIRMVMESLDYSKRLLMDENRLIKFAERTLSVTDPVIWNQFQEFCEEQHLSFTARATNPAKANIKRTA